MKCPHCGGEIFDGQFRCHHCYKIVEKPVEEKPKKAESKEKEK